MINSESVQHTHLGDSGPYVHTHGRGGIPHGHHGSKYARCNVAILKLPKAEGCCPFCGETDFDKPGLKSHLEHGDCTEYNNTESIKRQF